MLKRLGWAMALFALVTGLIAYAMSSPEPGRLSPAGVDAEADALANALVVAVGDHRWKQLDKVQFSFFGRGYTWTVRDKLVRHGDSDSGIVIDLQQQTCPARLQTHPVSENDCARAIRRWNNDSFWLHPFGKVLDPGVQRYMCQVEGEERPWLCIRFTQGGHTPGDLYAIRIGVDGRPNAWRMWVSILPMGGLFTAWEDWRQLPGGAWFAEDRRILGVTLPLKIIRVQ